MINPKILNALLFTTLIITTVFSTTYLIDYFNHGYPAIDFVFHDCYANNGLDWSACGYDYPYAPAAHALVIGMTALGLPTQTAFALIGGALVFLIGFALLKHHPTSFAAFQLSFLATFSYELQSNSILGDLQTGFIPFYGSLACTAWLIAFYNNLTTKQKTGLVLLGFLFHHFAGAMVLGVWACFWVSKQFTNSTRDGLTLALILTGSAFIFGLTNQIHNGFVLRFFNPNLIIRVGGILPYILFTSRLKILFVFLAMFALGTTIKHLLTRSDAVAHDSLD